MAQLAFAQQTTIIPARIGVESTSVENFVSPQILRIISGKTRIDERLNEVHSLGDNLEAQEITALCNFVRLHPDSEEGNLDGLRTLKNDIFTALREQSAPVEKLTDLLTGIYEDQAQDIVTRDYAIQHLTFWYNQCDAVDRQGIRSVLLKATQQNTSVAGTALLGLHRLSTKDASFTSDDIASIALKLAISSDATSATRATAIQVCSERQIKAALPTIENLVQTSTNLSLKVSAISSLGQLGGPRQATLLEHLEASSKNATVREAIRSALKQLTQKQEKLF